MFKIFKNGTCLKHRSDTMISFKPSVREVKIPERCFETSKVSHVSRGVVSRFIYECLVLFVTKRVIGQSTSGDVRFRLSCLSVTSCDGGESLICFFDLGMSLRCEPC